jgi:hypothetical protein
MYVGNAETARVRAQFPLAWGTWGTGRGLLNYSGSPWRTLWAMGLRCARPKPAACEAAFLGRYSVSLFVRTPSRHRSPISSHVIPAAPVCPAGAPTAELHSRERLSCVLSPRGCAGALLALLSPPHGPPVAPSRPFRRSGCCR